MGAADALVRWKSFMSRYRYEVRWVKLHGHPPVGGGWVTTAGEIEASSRVEAERMLRERYRSYEPPEILSVEEQRPPVR